MYHCKIQSNIAARVFLSIIATIIVLSFFIAGFEEADVISTSNFYTANSIIFIQYMMFLGIIIYFSRKIGIKKFSEYKCAYGVSKPKFCETYISVLLTALCICGFCLMTAIVIEGFGALGYVEGESGSLAITTLPRFLITLFTLAVLPAIIEELIFRGLILKSLENYGKIVAVVLSALLFMLFHLSPGQTFYQLALGIMLALVVLASGNLFYAMIIHFVNNCFSLTYLYIAGSELETPVISFKVVMVAVFLLFACSYFIVKLVTLLMRRRHLRTLKLGAIKSGDARDVTARLADDFVLILGILMACGLWVLVFISSGS